MSIRTFPSSVLLLSIIATAGCGGATDFGDIGAINGNVTFAGGPLAVGTKVIFMQLDTGYAGFGFTDDAGDYSIEWHREGTKYDGMPLGVYKVLVSPPGGGDVEEMSPDELLDGGADNAVPATRQFDKKYTETATSGIEFTIVAGPNVCDITLN